MKSIRTERLRCRDALMIGTGMAAALGVAAPAAAQDAADGEVQYAQPAEAYDETEATRGNAIIVTATKREQTLQDVPVAVTVTDENTIERAEIRDLRDLTSVQPSLRVTQLQSSANTNFIIRGFGNGANNAGIEPSVGVFVDGVYRSRSAAQIGDLPDLQRIEVLHGPQSTLFGKNASAGVISIVTAEPQFTFGGQVEASYGNFDSKVAKALLTAPLTDNIAASIAGGINKRDGYIDDLGTGGRTNGRDRWFTRGQLLFEPSSLFKVRIIGDYSNIDEDCCGVVTLRRGPTAGIVDALGGNTTDPSDPFADVVYNNFASSNDIDNYGVSGHVEFGFGPFELTSITAYRGTNVLTNQDSDFTSADLLGRNSQDLKIRTFTQEFRATAELAESVDLLLGAFYFNEDIEQDAQLLYGTQFRPYANAIIQSQTGGALNVGGLEQTIGALTGRPGAFDGQFFANGQGLIEAYALQNDSISLFGQVDVYVTDRLTLTGGLNYTKDKKDFQTNVTSTDVFAGVDLVQVGSTAIYQQALSTTIGNALMLGRPASQAEIQAFAGGNPAAFQQINAGSQAFAQANAANPQVNPLLALQALQFSRPFLNVPNAVEPGETDADNLTYTLRAAYDVTDDLNVYVSYATGFKAPSVNLSRDSRPTPGDRAALQQAGLLQVNQTFGSRFADEEESEVYELGIKGDFGPAAFSFAAFKQTITGFQSNIFTGTGFFLGNAGKQEVVGFEFDGTVRPVEPLSLRMAVTYLDPEYKDFQQSAFGDISGTTPAGIPSISATWAADYVHELASGDAVILHGDYNYQSRTQIVEGLPGFNSQGIDAALAAARPFTRQVDELAASITYAMQSGLELTAWGRNLLDDRYLQSIFDSPVQQFGISGYPNQPRTYGVTARYKF
ncbi:TonB-dependent receptor [uncultured Croceicoccus sp.]|uniref:TonB-dependent receptor n=1 Tax=uncultured Croceicoccus sp. TaxID=1295329 RepID=UPI0026091C61|nr:TonB-dependent receptor [uncultured Croceicoccus sp.]